MEPQTSNLRDRFRSALRESIADSVIYVTSCLVEGDVAEFGVFYGVSAKYFAEALSVFPPYDSIKDDRKLLLFDSFEGLPTPQNPKDLGSPKVTSGEWKAGGLKGPSPEEIRADILRSTPLPESRLQIHPGWFRDSIPALSASTRFALLHVDCDLYESTMDCLVPCFQNDWVSKGAMIMFDDWNSNQGSPEWGERKAWSELVQRFSIQFSDEGSYRGLGRKFIIHSYSS